MQPNDDQRFNALFKAFNTLLANQERIERRLARLEEQFAPQIPSVVEAPTDIPIHIPQVQAVIQPESEPAPIPEPERQDLESKVGLTLVNRIGVVTLVLGVAFFFKWAADNNWIGPAGRVVLGICAGFATLAFGDFQWKRRQAVFAQGITAVGIAVIYLSLYAAFGYYHLIPQSAAFVAMAATTAMASVLALRYASFAIAVLGLAAGYATPLLLATGEDHPWFLFSYVLLLNFAATFLAKRGNWPRLEIVSFTATTAIYAAWLMDKGRLEGNQTVATLAPLAFCAQRWFTQIPLLFAFSEALAALALSSVWWPAKPALLPLELLLAAAGLAFAHLRAYRFALLTAFVAFWLAYSLPDAPFLSLACGFLFFSAWLWWHLAFQKAAPTAAALTVLAVNGVAFYGKAYFSLRGENHLWQGPLAAAVAATYLGFGIFLHRRQAEGRPVMLALGVAITFLTLAIPIQFSGFTITIAWAVQAAALSWIAARLADRRALTAAACIFALVALRLLFIEFNTHGTPARFFTFTVSAAAMLLCAWWAARLWPQVSLAHYAAGNVFLLCGFTLEVLDWAVRVSSLNTRLSVETISVSVLFAVYAVALVSIGVATRSTVNRLAGLALFGLVILKLYLFDVWQLSRPYQILAFVILGALLLATSFLYSRFRRLIETWWKDDKTAA